MRSVSLRISYGSFTVNEQYSLELEGFLTRQEFQERIAKINETTKFYATEKECLENRATVVWELLLYALLMSCITAPLTFLGFYIPTGLFLFLVVLFYTLSMILHIAAADYGRMELDRVANLANEFNIVDNQKGINWRYTFESNGFTQRLTIEIAQPRVIGIIVHNYQGEASGEQRSKNTDSNETTPLL